MKKFSYSSGVSSTPLLGMTIGDKFDEIVEQFGDKDALIVHHQHIRWTYTELKRAVDSCAKSLIASGLKNGDRVGIWSPNRSEWTVLQFATAKIGIILVSINPAYRRHELLYVLNQSGCKMLVMAEGYKTSDYLELILQIVPEITTSQFGSLTSKSLPKLKMVVVVSEKRRPGFFNWQQLLETAAGIKQQTLENLQRNLSFDDPVNIQYTSGTTGYPKGVTLSHHNILNNGYFVARTMNFSERERLIIPVPLYHCFGMVMGNLGCMTHGATMIYPSEAFEPLAVLRAVEKEKATAIYGVPTMFIAQLEVLEFDQFDLSTLRTGIMAGSPCPVEVMKKVQTVMHMSEVQIAYGMTETSPVSTQTKMGTSLQKQVSTVGQVHPHVEVKIVDEQTGLVTPIGVPGELCTRGYSIMLGYWNDEEKTNEAIDRARWMHTGDIATMDEEGFVNIVGRIKDMIIRGGENIYPKEIEEFLYRHPKISDVQVIGVPSEKYGEEVMAWIIPKTGMVLTEAEIIDFCTDNISYFKVPKFYKFTNRFPMTVTGKVRKIEMREISVKEMK